MDDALFFIKMLDSQNNVIDVSSNKVIIRSKRKIAAMLRPPSEDTKKKITSKKKVKFTSNIFINHVIRFPKIKKRKRSYSQNTTYHSKSEECKRLRLLLAESEEMVKFLRNENKQLVDQNNELKKMSGDKDKKDDLDYLMKSPFPLPISFDDIYF